jgi:RNA polymerase sigma-70 factor (ECF subfamily)
MQDNRQARFEAVYRAHYEAVRRYAVRRTDSLEAAEEVVADTFLVCWRRLAEVPAEPLPWLYGVARRTLANQRRAAGRATATLERARQDRSASTTDRDPADVLAGGEAVRRVLGGLSATEREAIMLVAWEGLHGAEAARAAGCSRLAFGTRLYRARRRMASLLADEEHLAAFPRPMETTP